MGDRYFQSMASGDRPSVVDSCQDECLSVLVECLGNLPSSREAMLSIEDTRTADRLIGQMFVENGVESTLDAIRCLRQVRDLSSSMAGVYRLVDSMLDTLS